MKKTLLFCIMGLLYAGSAIAQHDVQRTTHVYCVKDQDSLYLDIFEDKALVSEAPRPVMIYVHGGAFSAGSRKNAAQEVFSRHYAEQGYVSVSIDYRLGLAEGNHYGARNLTEVVLLGNEDLLDATLFLLNKKDELNIDPAKIILAGGSAGAVNCLALEYDLCSQKPFTKRLPEGFDYAGVISQAGCLLLEEDDQLHWRRMPCPIMLMHGDLNGENDGYLPLHRAKLVRDIVADDLWGGSYYLDQTLNEINAPHWTYIEKGADHCVAIKSLTANLDETDFFIKQFVWGKKQGRAYTEIYDQEPVSMSDVQQMIKFAPLYILGYGMYLDEMQQQQNQPTGVVL